MFKPEEREEMLRDREWIKKTLEIGAERSRMSVEEYLESFRMTVSDDYADRLKEIWELVSQE